MMHIVVTNIGEKVNIFCKIERGKSFQSLCTVIFEAPQMGIWYTDVYWREL